MEVPECPVCLESMTVPIYQCDEGHSLCSVCTTALRVGSQPCPICRKPMTTRRNWMLEDVITRGPSVRTRQPKPKAGSSSSAKLPCPNNSSGCGYILPDDEALYNHMCECIFRDMRCAFGRAHGNCTWSGKLKKMMDHYKEHHPDNWYTSANMTINLSKFTCTGNSIRVYLVVLGNMHFILTLKVDVAEKVAYWTIQHYGSKKSAKQYTYEIQLVNKRQNARSKVVFTERCFNDHIEADKIYEQGKCPIVPLRLLAHYISDEKFSFSFSIKKERKETTTS